MCNGFFIIYIFIDIKQESTDSKKSGRASYNMYEVWHLEGTHHQPSMNV